MAAGIRITGYGKIINAWNGTCSPNLKRKGAPLGESYSHLSRGRPPQGSHCPPLGRVNLGRDAVGEVPDQPDMSRNQCPPERTIPGVSGFERNPRQPEPTGQPRQPRNLEPALRQPWRHQNGNWNGMSRRMTIRQPFDLALSLETGQAFRWRRVGDEEIRHRDWGDPPARWHSNGGAWYSGVLGEYLVHLCRVRACYNRDS